MLAGLLAPGLLDENAAHGLGRGCKEVAAAVPVLDLVGIHEPEVRLVHQRRGLERLPGLLLRQFVCRKFSQLLVNKRQEMLGGVRIAALDGRQDSGYVAHKQAVKAWGSTAEYTGPAVLMPALPDAAASDIRYVKFLRSLIPSTSLSRCLQLV